MGIKNKIYGDDRQKCIQWLRDNEVAICILSHHQRWRTFMLWANTQHWLKQYNITHDTIIGMWRVARRPDRVSTEHESVIEKRKQDSAAAASLVVDAMMRMAVKPVENKE